jgi:serine/threonine-protein kinase
VLGSIGPDGASAVLRRFEHEARATASLESPHTISLYDFGVADDGVFYYVMELLEGLDLESIVETYGPIPEARAVYLIEQACRSLEEAHQRGMIHRDVKPANIYVCKVGVEYDFVKVLDFGLVISEPGAAEPLTRLTAEGFTSGTPAYMAPEMAASGAKVDARADLYGLGCVAYFILTGQLVFDSPSPMKLIADHLTERPIPPSARKNAPNVSSDVEAIVLQCLEKDPRQRPESARDLAERLRASSVWGRWTERDAKTWWSERVRGLHENARLQAGQ